MIFLIGRLHLFKANLDSLKLYFNVKISIQIDLYRFEKVPLSHQTISKLKSC